MVLAGLLASVERASAQSWPESCSVPPDLARLDLPLSRVAQRVVDEEPMKIIAIGSSSTAGAGASSRDFSYPSRLQVELRTRFRRDLISVINRGVAGEEAPQRASGGAWSPKNPISCSGKSARTPWFAATTS
jgi:acyl-CoA thioesterase I